MSEVAETKKIRILGDEEDDLIAAIEHSFNIELSVADCSSVRTFGDLCSIVSGKMNVEDNGDCTSQQAFYKLRNAIADVQQIDASLIAPKTDLHSIFPRKNRRAKFKQMDELLGFPIYGLERKGWVITLGVLAFLVSIVMLFINWKLAIAGFIFSYLANAVSKLSENELRFKTVDELAESIARNNYMSVRRNPKTANKKEILQKMRELFSEQTGINIADITPDARFV